MHWKNNINWIPAKNFTIAQLEIIHMDFELISRAFYYLAISLERTTIFYIIHNAGRLGWLFIYFRYLNFLILSLFCSSCCCHLYHILFTTLLCWMNQQMQLFKKKKTNEQTNERNKEVIKSSFQQIIGWSILNACCWIRISSRSEYCVHNNWITLFSIDFYYLCCFIHVNIGCWFSMYMCMVWFSFHVVCTLLSCYCLYCSFCSLFWCSIIRWLLVSCLFVVVGSAHIFRYCVRQF